MTTATLPNLAPAPAEADTPPVCEMLTLESDTPCGRLAVVEAILSCPGLHEATLRMCSSCRAQAPLDGIWCTDCDPVRPAHVVVERPL